MPQLTYLLSTVLTGLVLLAIVAAVLRGADWYRYTPPSADDGGGLLSAASDAAASPTAWILGFLVLVLGFGGAAVLYVGGMSLPDGAVRAVGVVMVAGFALLLALLAFVGAYDAARSRGRPSAAAAAEGVGLLGLLLVVAIAVKLLAS